MKPILITLAAFALLPLSALAAPKVDGGELTLLTPGAGLGDTVAFEYTLSGKVNECPGGGENRCARIQVVCVQGTTTVYAEAAPAVQPTPFVLGGGWSPWRDLGGSADCVATLYYWRFHPSQEFVPLDSVAF